MQAFLEKMVQKHRPQAGEGKVADYIPELSRQNSAALGVSVYTSNGETFSAGDCSVQYSLQSISKVITLIIALMDWGPEKVFERVGMEPTGNPFNAISDLELYSPKKPLNPMINSGALVVSSMIEGLSVEERLERVLKLVQDMSGNPDIGVDEAVYHSERATGYRNRSMAYFLKEFGVIEDVEATLELYFRQCAISVTCNDLSRMGFCLSRHGENAAGQQVTINVFTRRAKERGITCWPAAFSP